MIDVSLRQLISPPYQAAQRILHAEKLAYGHRGDKWAGIVLQVAMQYRCTSILDYGCGEGALVAALRSYPMDVRLAEYDPAIDGKDTLPEPADLVNVTDVLEHVEPDRLHKVLHHLKMLAQKAIFVVVSTKKEARTLPDGRNVHLTVQPGRWWKAQFLHAGFTLNRAPSVVRNVPEKEWTVVLTVPPPESEPS